MSDASSVGCAPILSYYIHIIRHFQCECLYVLFQKLLRQKQLKELQQNLVPVHLQTWISGVTHLISYFIVCFECCEPDTTSSLYVKRVVSYLACIVWLNNSSGPLEFCKRLNLCLDSSQQSSWRQFLTPELMPPKSIRLLLVAVVVVGIRHGTF